MSCNVHVQNTINTSYTLSEKVWGIGQIMMIRSQISWDHDDDLESTPFQTSQKRWNGGIPHSVIRECSWLLVLIPMALTIPLCIAQVQNKMGTITEWSGVTKTSQEVSGPDQIEIRPKWDIMFYITTPFVWYVTWNSSQRVNTLFCSLLRCYTCYSHTFWWQYHQYRMWVLSWSGKPDPFWEVQSDVQIPWNGLDH